MPAAVRCSKTLAVGMAALVLAGSARAQGALPGRMAAGARGVVARESEALTVEGFVLDTDGRPAEGAVVVSSAGGKALTDASGRYVLEIEVPLGAESLEVTAAGRAGTNQLASRRIDLSTTSRHAAVDPLQLARGVTCLPHWLPTFGAAPGVNGVVRALAAFDDGGGPELYIGGDFIGAGAAQAYYVAKWDGAAWSSLGSSTGGPVQALVVFDAGDGPALYAGGTFTTAGGIAANRIARWDGASWSALGPGLDGTVEALAVFDDGGGPALYAGGEFTGRIAKWNGVSWTTVGGGIVTGAVRALLVHDDGGGAALYAGGTFFFAGGVSARRVAKWDGASWSGLADGLDDDVETLAVFDDGGGAELYVGGWFTVASGTPANRVARWDGTSWSALGTGRNSVVYGLATFDGGGGAALYATGSFTGQYIARWSGASWSNVGGGLNAGGATLATLDLGSGAALFAGGIFTLAGGVAANGVARWNGTWAGFGDGLGYGVLSLAVFDDGSGPALHAAGYFQSAGGVQMNRIASWDGTSWAPLGSGLNGIATGDVVSAMVVHDDGSGPALYAGGGFTSIGGATRNRIARWNGSSWSSLGTGMSNVVYALTVYDDGGGPALYAGGFFGTAGGVAASCIARWNGASWSALGSGMNSGVEALAVFDDGSGPALYAGGQFTTAGGVPASRIAKWDGSSWSALGSGVSHISSARVEVLEVFDDGTGPALYAGGYFTSAGGGPANYVARWDGSSWSPLGSGMNSAVYALKSFDDGTGPALFVGGAFGLAGGMATGRLARWDGSSWSPLGSGLSSSVHALAVFDDGSGSALHVGGFGTALDSGDSFLAKWGCTDTEAPTIFHPTRVGALDRLGSTPGEIVTFVVTATDDQDSSPDVVCVPPSGSFFPPGTTLVDCTATDASGNESTAQFPVVVRSKVDQRSP